MRTNLIWVVLAACSVPPSQDVVVTVNERPITHAEVERLAHSSHGSVPEKAVLESLISQELAAQRAAELDLSPDEAGQREIARAEAELLAVQRRVLSNALYAAEEKRSAALSPGELHAYFEKHAAELRLQAHVRMAMTRSEETLEGAELRDLGWLNWAQLPAPWRDVVRSMKPGDKSGVIHGDHGRVWKLELVDSREGPALSFEQALPLVQQAVAVERSSAARDALDATLRQRARIIYAPQKPEPVAANSAEP